jgi:hypothetical protein
MTGSVSFGDIGDEICWRRQKRRCSIVANGAGTIEHLEQA